MVDSYVGFWFHCSLNPMLNNGMQMGQISGSMDWLLQGQSVMVATNQIFMAIAVIFSVAAFVIWLAPKPRVVDTSAVH